MIICNVNAYLVLISKTDFTSWPYYANIGFGIVQAIILAFITKILIDKSLRKSKSIGDGLSKIGIEKVELESGRLSISDQNILFSRHRKKGMPEQLKLCFLTGVNFFFDFQEDLRNLVKNGKKIQVLLLNPTNDKYYQEYKKDLANYDTKKRNFPDALRKKIIERAMYNWELKDENYAALSYAERNSIMLSSAYFNESLKGKSYEQLSDQEKYELWNKQIHAYGNDVTEAIIVMKLLEEIDKDSKDGGGIELHFYVDEYQIPITLAEYDYGDSRKRKSYIMLWTNISAPVKEAIESVNVLGIKEGNKKASFIEDMNLSFDYLVKKYPKDFLHDSQK